MLGAAASLIVGIAAIALVADRAEAPTGVADTVAASPSTSSAPPSSEHPTPATDVTAPPTWTVTEPGWVSAPPLVSFDPGVAAVTLVAGPAGVAESWVAIVDGMSDPLMSVGGLAADFPQTPTILTPDSLGLDESPTDARPGADHVGRRSRRNPTRRSSPGARTPPSATSSCRREASHNQMRRPCSTPSRQAPNRHPGSRCSPRHPARSPSAG